MNDTGSNVEPRGDGAIRRSVPAWAALSRVPRSYAVYLVASGVDGLGVGVARLAFPWLLFSLTHSAFVLGLASFAQLAASWVTPFLGVVTDRMDRRRAIAIGTAGRAVCWGLIIVMATGTFGYGSGMIAGVLTLAFLQQACGNLALQARSALRQALTPPQARLGINTFYFTVQNIAWYVSPALGGLVIARLGAVAALYVTVVALFLMLIPTLGLPAVSAEPRGETPLGVGRELREGFRVLRGETMLGWLTAFGFLYNGVWTAVSAVAIALYRADLHMGAVEVGLVTLAAGLATTGFGILTPWIERHVRAHQVLTGALVMSGVGMATLGAAGGWPEVAAGLALTDLPSTPWLVLTNLVTQARIPERVYGRVNALRSTLSTGANPLWALLAGGVAEVATPRVSIVAMGALTLVAVLILQRTPLRSLVWPAVAHENSADASSNPGR